MTEPNEFAGKVALVSGGAGGIGQVLSARLAALGIHVAVADVNEEAATKLASEISTLGAKAIAVPMNVTDTADIRRGVDATCDEFGRFDFLINSAGIFREEHITDVTEANFDLILNINLRSAMFLAQAAAKRQLQFGNGGKQVHILSVRAKLGLRDKGYSAYCASKGGLLMLVRQHAVELAPKNIQVNGVAPTFVYTEMIRRIMNDPAQEQALIDRIPAGRLATPEDVVGPVKFFCSQASNFVAGQVLYVDGALSATQ